MQPRTTWAETRRPAALDGVIPVSVHRYCIFITRSVCGHHFPLKWRRAIGAEESQIRSVVSSTLPGQLRALSLVWKTPVSLRCGYNMSFTDSLPFKLLTNVRSTATSQHASRDSCSRASEASLQLLSMIAGTSIARFLQVSS